MLEIITKKNDWNNILKTKFKKYYDTYFLWEYFNLYEENYICKKELIFFEDETIIVFFPHLVRKIDNVSGLEKYKNYFDCTTPYGYGGPLLIKKTNEYKKSLNIFFEQYKIYSNNQNYITEFIRFTPWFDNYKNVDHNIDIVKLNNVIVLSLEGNIDTIWMNSLIGKRRNQIRKEEKIVKNIKINDFTSDKEIVSFLDIYSNTMKKNNAEEKYFFSNKFIKDTFKIGKTFFIKTLDFDDNILSQSIFFGHGDTLHYHLSASNYTNGYGTSSLILWEAIKFAKVKGYKYFMLGGGTSNKIDNSLYKFKKSFGGIDKSFYLGKIIFDEKKYHEINNVLNLENNGFFPLYRKEFINLI